MIFHQCFWRLFHTLVQSPLTILRATVTHEYGASKFYMFLNMAKISSIYKRFCRIMRKWERTVADLKKKDRCALFMRFFIDFSPKWPFFYKNLLTKTVSQPDFLFFSHWIDAATILEFRIFVNFQKFYLPLSYNLSVANQQSIINILLDWKGNTISYSLGNTY